MNPAVTDVGTGERQTSSEETLQNLVAVMARKERWRGRRHVALAVTTPIVLLLAWQSAAQLGLIDAQLFPPPSQVLTRAGMLVVSGELAEHLSATLFRLAAGYVLGAVTGVAMGLAMGTWRPVNAAFGPMFSALYALPKVAILPLLLLIFGLTETPKVLAVAITVFFVVQISTTAAVRQIDPRVLDAARAYRATGWRQFRFVTIPGCLPQIFTGLRVAVGLSVAVLIAVEFVASNSGLGYLIWNSWQLFQPERMYVGLAVAALLGAVLAGTVHLAEYLALPWRRTSRFTSAARKSPAPEKAEVL